MTELDPKLIKKALGLSQQLGQRWCTDEDFMKIHLDDRDWAEREVTGDSQGISGNMYIIHGVLRGVEDGGDKEHVLMPVMFADWPPPRDARWQTIWPTRCHAEDCRNVG